ncbi:MAG: hypothetical protein PHU63_00935, partial [Candidatus ainarchaeum sp.]|nr:hypothetical protein [Candidatus ainarchaeum sp.]
MKNIILITVDCLRYDHSRIIINKINEVLGEGIEFENAYATGNFTGSSFPGILCSKFIDMPGEDMKYNLERINGYFSASDGYDPNYKRKRVYITEIIRNKYKTISMNSNPYLGTPEYQRSFDKIISKQTKRSKDIKKRFIAKEIYQILLKLPLINKIIPEVYQIVKTSIKSKNLGFDTYKINAEKNG